MNQLWREETQRSVGPWDGHVWHMQLEAQTTTCGFLALTVGALEKAIVIQDTLEVWTLYLLPLLLEAAKTAR